MPRILLVGNYLPRPDRTGLENYSDSLANWLLRLAPRFEFTLVTFNEPDQELPWFASNLALPLPDDVAAGSRQSTHNAKASQYDLVHMLASLPMITRKPMPATVHDLIPFLLPEGYPWYSSGLAPTG
jgi:hypothetical protein